MNYLGINHLLAKSFANILSHSAGCLFILLTVAFAVQKSVSFNRSHVGFFFFFFFSCFIKPLSPAINKCHTALEVSCLSMWQKEFPQRKEIMLTSEHDYNDHRERERIGPVCALPQSPCSKME